MIAAVVLVAMLGGCEGERVQSMLHPAGPSAERIAELWWVMFGVYALVFILTMLALWLALRAKRSEQPVVGNRFIAVTGVFIPLVILIAMLIYTIGVTVQLAPRDSDMTVRVIGHQFWWEVHYPEHDIVTANELYIPVNASVELELLAADVIHSFWVPELAEKMDLLPEHPNSLWIEANRPGLFRGQCAEYCGTQHARMAFYVVAVEEAEFEQWVADRHAAVDRLAERAEVIEAAAAAGGEIAQAEPEDPIERGEQVFLAAGCGGCHGIEGLREPTQAGPDLTHIGTRLTLGAGTIANTPENLREFIRDPHQFKPGLLMPATPLESDDMDALVAYLMSLE